MFLIDSNHFLILIVCFYMFVFKQYCYNFFLDIETTHNHYKKSKEKLSKKARDRYQNPSEEEKEKKH